MRHRIVHDAGCDFADEIVCAEEPLTVDERFQRSGVCTCGANPQLEALEPVVCESENDDIGPLEILARRWDEREWPDAMSYSHTAVERAVQHCATELRAVIHARLNLRDEE